MQKIEQTKTVHIDQCTPIKVIEKPAKAGPITLAICQTELLQVALGYTF
jgi:TPP-dependent trihydroxycyclohexane-1,2-dione (THcHDO) dehydratase